MEQLTCRLRGRVSPSAINSSASRDGRVDGPSTFVFAPAATRLADLVEHPRNLPLNGVDRCDDCKCRCGDNTHAIAEVAGDLARRLPSSGSDPGSLRSRSASRPRKDPVAIPRAGEARADQRLERALRARNTRRHAARGRAAPDLCQAAEPSGDPRRRRPEIAADRLLDDLSRRRPAGGRGESHTGRLARARQPLRVGRPDRTTTTSSVASAVGHRPGGGARGRRGTATRARAEDARDEHDGPAGRRRGRRHRCRRSSRKTLAALLLQQGRPGRRPAGDVHVVRRRDRLHLREARRLTARDRARRVMAAHTRADRSARRDSATG